MELHEDGYIKSYDSTELYYVKDIPENPKGIVIIVHGFAEHLGRYNYLTERLNSASYGVYRFDNRGHGKTKGEKGHIDKFESYFLDTDILVDMTKKEYAGLPTYMLGHSMGGFIAASYGIKYKDKLNGQILSAAATVKPSEVSGIKGPVFQILDYIMPKFRVKNPITNSLCRDKDVVEDYIKDPLNIKDATIHLYVEFLIKGIGWLNRNMEIYNYPCLILHGNDDKIVIKRASENFYNKIQSIDKKIIIYEGLYHEIIKEKTKDNVIDDICSWLNNRIS